MPEKLLAVSTYVPKHCGIATFTRDLLQGIKQNAPELEICVAAMVDHGSQNLDYPTIVRHKIRRNIWEDYQELVDQINSGPIDKVLIQHEYGIFGGDSGEYIVRFMKGIKKPIMTTLHTILPEPDEEKKAVLQRVTERSTMNVAMLERGVDILDKVYEVTRDKMRVIPHGVPDFGKLTTEACKAKLGLGDRVVMISNNLLAPVKGINYAINAVKEIKKEVPNILYLVVGQTHPDVVEQQGGDLLMEELVGLVKELELKDHVEFVNKYVLPKEQKLYIMASDFFMTPYLDPDQATSGSLAYGIGAGKACISTPSVYAQEMLGDGSGRLVQFKDSQSIAEAVIDLHYHPDKKRAMEYSTKLKGQEMKWTAVSRKYLDVLDQVAA